MLMWPKFNTPFEPTLFYWLGGISVFDREETIGAALWVYNPNEQLDRERIIKDFILTRFDHLSYRHRFLLFKILEDSLSQTDFDFLTQFEGDEDTNTYLAWDETEIDDPRGFFEDIYELASEMWKEDLDKANLEDKTTW
ncbi:hypothetical protein CS078_22815 [Pseudomonas prosekii]|uniref:CdiI immunity protein domain-containing protein n=1 Tax=Pseudomonas prosekii TaxID=1148509 RepID=A0A3L8CCX8_9PSED|nr:hypothetical protein [Pseudomonas prosekii]RLU04666.1 hypothetical protein CS076_25895 [Pseudomonas prosekii]RLU06015.1 hypothetical protein CS078_22815 [Pseudomonas prosekii]